MEPSVSTGPPSAVDDAARAAPLPTDPQLRVHRLPNGLTVWIRPNARPEGEVGLRLHLRCGSLCEEDDQRGLAHFLEHLVFRGTENFPPGAMEAFFDSLGTRLGREHNAATGLQHTVFSLTLPTGDAEVLDQALLCLGDIACRLRPAAATIEAERRVILEEIRDRRDRTARWENRVRRFEIPAPRAHSRHPLGEPSVLAAANVERLLAFYRRWYRPDLATLLVAGDVEPESLAARLAERFGHWGAAGPTPAAPSPGLLLDTAARARVLASHEQRDAEIRVVAVRAGQPPPTRGGLADDLGEQLAIHVLNRRLVALASSNGVAVHRTGAVRARLFADAQIARVWAAGAPDRPEPLARTLFEELLRFGRYGVLPSELDKARSAWRSAARRERDGEEKTGALLARMQRALTLGRPPMSPGQRLALTEELLDEVDIGRVRAAFGRVFEVPAPRLVALLPEGARPPGAEELLAWLGASRRRRVKRPSEREGLGEPPAHTTPRRVVERTTDPDLDVLSATLEHGVRLHLRRMLEPPGRVVLRLTLGGGRIQETVATHGLTSAAASIFQAPSTDELEAEAVRDLMVGRGLQMGATVDEDCLKVGLSCAREDLEMGLRLLAALLHRPRIEAAAFDRWLGRIRVWRPDLEARMAERSLELLTGGDVRFRFLEPEAAERIDRRAAQNWLDELVRDGSVEVGIVGDLDPPETLELARRLLGGLDERSATAEHLAPLRTLRPARGPMRGEVAADDDARRAAVFVGWRAPPWQAVRERRLLLVAQRILQGRLSRVIREQEGLAYSPRCSYSPSQAYPQASLLAVAFYTDPERVDRGAEAARRQVEELARQGPGEEETEHARKQFDRLIETTHRKPVFWARTLSDLHLHGGRLEAVKQARQEYAGIRSEEVREALARAVVEDGRIEVVSRPPAPG